MRDLLLLVLLLIVAPAAKAQDATWMLEQAPVVSMVLANVFEKLPSFSAQAEVKVFSKADPLHSTAIGTFECKAGDLRWEVKLADISSPQLSETAKALLQQVNGGRLLLLTQLRDAANQLIFPGVRACIAQPLPNVTFSARRTLGNEVFDGRSCLRERVRVSDGTGRAYDLMLWKAKDLQKLPVQIQFAEAGEVIRIRLKDVQFRPLPSGRFQTPAGMTKHEAIEDLMQSVLAEKIKKRMGL